MKRHLPEYASEAVGLGLFMLSAACATTVVEHPGSPIRQAIADPVVRRLLVGVAMALTAMALIYSPLGARSGAHLNPALTVIYYRLGKVAGGDAIAYALAQFVGGLAGLALAAALLHPALGHISVRYIATTPGTAGVMGALAAEAAISFGLMVTVLAVSNHPRLSRLTGVFAGALIAGYITLEAPLSGMSMNPARSFAPSLLAGTEDTVWIYFVAPPLGMLAAAELYLKMRGPHRVLCAKLNHAGHARCLFNCGYAAAAPTQENLPCPNANA